MLTRAKAEPKPFVDLSQRPEKLLTHGLQKELPLMAQYLSTRSLKKSQLYTALKPEIEKILFGSEYGFYNDEPTTARPKKFYRAVFWNLAGELNYQCFLEVLKEHPILRKADFFLFTHADIGMGRTANRNIVRSLALELSYNYVFTCSHIYLTSHPKFPALPNQYGIVGQAIMTPHPLSSFSVSPLTPVLDPLQRKIKMIGCEKSLFVQIDLPNKPLTLACTKLDSSSSPRQRARQMGECTKALSSSAKNRAILFGGALNTTTYNSRHALPQFFSFFNKVVRGYDYICEEHHVHPEIFFERKVFDLLGKNGFHYKDFNEAGKPTIHVPFEELEVQGGIEKQISHMMVKTLKRFFYHGPEHIALKVDWFAGNARIRPSTQPQAERPKVLSNLYHDADQISSHHPIVLDFEVE